MTTSELAAIWTFFADTSCRAYSPLYDRVCRSVAASNAVLDLVNEAPPRAHMPTNLLAAVHYLVLAGADHPLSAVYAGTSAADPGPLFVDFCLEHRDAILALLATEHTNTNEVGRSAFIGPALTTIAARHGEPLAHIDVGCSAGLNLLCDRYRLDYGAQGCTGSGNFSVTTIRDLSLDVEWKNVPAGTHTQQITLVQPNGVVYQTVSHAFSVPDGTIGSPALNDVIPVAGTFIMQRSLTGQWSVEVSLDGATIGKQSFEFEQ